MARRQVFYAAVAVAALSVAGAANAADLGVRGALFPIIEVNLLDLIRAKLEAAKVSGKIDALNQAFRRRSINTVEHPPAVAGLIPTTSPRSWLYDPSVVVPHDYVDNQGRVLAKAGARINPLLHMPEFDRVMVFFDGDDDRQVDLALRTLHRYGAGRTRLILVKGSPVTLMRREQTPIFFDQMGLLSARFELRQVPAVIQREGDQLRISEVRP